MLSFTSTQLRQIEQRRIKQLEQLDRLMMERGLKLLPPFAHWVAERAQLAEDLAAVRVLLDLRRD